MQVNFREGFRAVRFSRGQSTGHVDCTGPKIKRSLQQSYSLACLWNVAFCASWEKKSKTQMGSKGKMCCWCIESNQHQQLFDIRKTKVTQNFLSPTCYHMLHNPTWISKKKNSKFSKFEVKIGVTSICIHGGSPCTYRESNHLFSLRWFLTLKKAPLETPLRIPWHNLLVRHHLPVGFPEGLRNPWETPRVWKETKKKLEN